MPKIKNKKRYSQVKGKSGVDVELPKPKDLQKILIKICCNSMTQWQRTYVLPSAIQRAPLYSGLDPRTEYHPQGLLKRYLGLVNAKVHTGETYKTVGVPGSSTKGATTPQDRTWIITQVLHRGWTAPKSRTGFMTFPVKRENLRNPSVVAPPPPGIKATEDSVWIIIPYARANKGPKLNRFYTDAFMAGEHKIIEIIRTNIKRDLKKVGRGIKIRMVK